MTSRRANWRHQPTIDSFIRQSTSSDRPKPHESAADERPEKFKLKYANEGGRNGPLTAAAPHRPARCLAVAIASNCKEGGGRETLAINNSARPMQRHLAAGKGVNLFIISPSPATLLFDSHGPSRCSFNHPHPSIRLQLFFYLFSSSTERRQSFSHLAADSRRRASAQLDADVTFTFQSN